MNNKLTISRMLELEEFLKNGNTYNNLSEEDLEYLELAKKMPYNYMVELIECYRKNFFVEKKQVLRILEILFNCNKHEAAIRFRNVNHILNYKNKELNYLVQKHKQMVKKLN